MSFFFRLSAGDAWLIWTCLIWTCHHHPPSFFAVYSTTAWDDAPNIYRGSGELWQLPVYPGDPLSLGPWGAGMIGSGFFHQNHVDFTSETSETWGIPYHSKPCFACGRWVVLWRPSLFCASDLRQLDATVGYRLDTEKKRFRRAGNMNLLSTRLM